MVEIEIWLPGFECHLLALGLLWSLPAHKAKDAEEKFPFHVVVTI